YIADFLYQQGVNHIFLVSGGGMMFLSDGIASQSKIKAVCTHHEQAAAMAAASYAKFTRNLGVAYLTTGCGGTNAITGVLNAWQDNVPCLFISGQSKRKETVRNSNLKLRQFGVQEADIISIVESITKYSLMINDPNDIKFQLEKSVFLAKSGRPGPVWLDIPLDVQSALIEVDNLRSFSSDELELPYKELATVEELEYVKSKLRSSKRPIIIAGQGIRISNGIKSFKNFIEKYKIPYVASRLGIDLLPGDHPLFIGRIGNKGDRAGNFAVQNSDLVIAIGSRLSVSSTGHEYETFAREAKLIVIDIDPIEHSKNTVKIDRFINCDAKMFLTDIMNIQSIDRAEWINKCSGWKNEWPVCLPEYWKNDEQGINSYVFVDVLSKNLKQDSVIISDAGSAFYVVSQGIMLKDNQRYITSGGQAEMGYTTPASVGVCFARNNQETIGILGDGSFQMNIQELQTIVHHNLPVKLFVWNNDGYSSIRETQEKFFDKRFIGTDSSSGVTFPSLEKIAFAYGIKFFRIHRYNHLDDIVKQVLSFDGPVLCEVICPRSQKVAPTVSSMRKDDGSMVSMPIEDMYPFLDRTDFYSNMIIKPLKK
ncbi:thiamine pyrophosphate-binding protein, partial [Bacteroidota bacterium]